MPKKVIWSAVAILVAVAVWLVLTPSPIRTPSIGFEVRVGNGNNQQPQVISVVVSNICDGMLVYYPEVAIAFQRNNAWETSSVSHAIGGIGSTVMMLKPGESDGPYLVDVIVPTSSEQVTVKAGLTITRLSWRGKLAWKASKISVLHPVSTWLNSLDRSSRTATEWSEDTTIIPFTNAAAPGSELNSSN